MRRGTAAALALVCAAGGCSAKRSAPEAPRPAGPVAAAAATPVAVRTVPPQATASSGGAPLPTRPVKNPKAEAEKRAGKTIGPIVTFAGAARADGQVTEPIGKSPEGYPIFQNAVGSGFMIVVEGKPGLSNLEVGRAIFKYDANDPSLRPDLEIEVDHPLGDGSPEVCDARRPKIGGIPAINPPSFAENKQVSAALNDLSCRFETFIESTASCTVQKNGDFSFVNPKESKVQFCMVVARAWNFPPGDTLVSVRLRDVEGNPGPVTHFIVRRKENPAPPPRAVPTPTPTVPRRRP
jgi:hypothetical protein